MSKEKDFATLSMMGAIDEDLAKFMTPKEIADFRAWEKKNSK